MCNASLLWQVMQAKRIQCVAPKGKDQAEQDLFKNAKIILKDYTFERKYNEMCPQ